jgi:hypothetical protein
MSTVKTLDDFRREVDPMFVDKSPVPVFNRKLPAGTKSIIITSAQNATPVHAGFWRALMAACNTYGSEMMVDPIRYKNPTSRWTGSQENAEHWVEEVRPYLCSTRTKLNKNCLFLADIKIQPTASDPLTGFEAISQDMSAIVGHPKVQTRTIATPQNKLPKILMTTGACTVANYSDTRAGRVGEFHHSLSAVIVELQGGLFFARRLHYDTKTQSITDTVRRKQFFADGKVKTSERAAALVTGDLHERMACPKAVEATWGAGGMVEVGEPEHIIYHDSVDGCSVNPHHGKDPFSRIAKANSGFTARHEIESFRDFVVAHTRRKSQNVIVMSNHDDFFTRYIKSQDWRDDPINADWYLETALHMVRNTHMTSAGVKHPDALRYWLEKYNLKNTRLLSSDESFVIRNVELGMHGNRGPNGSRGSVKNLRRIGVKSVVGHVHVPQEDEGCTSVGTMTRLRLDYNSGPSGWLNANCFVNADGKRQLIFIIDGKFHN